ncbi:phage adaptor protein, partial [Herbiconiux daphne]
MQNINTYLDLKNSVAAWLNRKDQATLDNIPNFINFAEKQFTRLVKLPYYEVTVNFQIDPQYPFIVLPQDFLSAKHIMVNNEPYNRTDVETFYRLQGTRQFSGTVITTDDVVGMDNFKAFTRIGEQIHFYPTPQAGDIVTMIYSQDIPEMQFVADQPYSL